MSHCCGCVCNECTNPTAPGCTGCNPVTAWHIVYNDELIQHGYLENNQVSCMHTVETFATEAEMLSRIAELGFTPLTDEGAE